MKFKTKEELLASKGLPFDYLKGEQLWETYKRRLGRRNLGMSVKDSIKTVGVPPVSEPPSTEETIASDLKHVDSIPSGRLSPILNSRIPEEVVSPPDVTAPETIPKSSERFNMPDYGFWANADVVVDGDLVTVILDSTFPDSPEKDVITLHKAQVACIVAQAEAKRILSEAPLALFSKP